MRVREQTAGRDLNYPPLPEPLVVGVYDNHTHLEIADGEGPLDYREQLDRAASVGVRGVDPGRRRPRDLALVGRRPPRSSRACSPPSRSTPTRRRATPLRGELDDASPRSTSSPAQPRVRRRRRDRARLLPHRGDEGRAAQHRSFEAHIDIAKQHGLALQIHDRDAHDDVIETLLRVGAPERTVFHCFSGDAEMARLCAENGWYLSFAGNVTFKNADNLREALAVAPRSCCSSRRMPPSSRPTPFRGRPNAPYLIPHTLRAMAGYLDTDVSMLAAQITSNTELVYGRWDAEPVRRIAVPSGGLA